MNPHLPWLLRWSCLFHCFNVFWRCIAVRILQQNSAVLLLVSDMQKYVFVSEGTRKCLEKRKYQQIPGLLLKHTCVMMQIEIAWWAPFIYAAPMEPAEMDWFFSFLSGFSFTTIHEPQDCRERGRAFLLTSHQQYYLLHRHLEISRVITTESSPLQIGSSQTQIRKLWFPSASH